MHPQNISEKLIFNKNVGEKNLDNFYVRNRIIFLRRQKEFLFFVLNFTMNILFVLTSWEAWFLKIDKFLNFLFIFFIFLLYDKNCHFTFFFFKFERIVFILDIKYYV